MSLTSPRLKPGASRDVSVIEFDAAIAESLDDVTVILHKAIVHQTESLCPAEFGLLNQPQFVVDADDILALCCARINDRDAKKPLAAL